MPAKFPKNTVKNLQKYVALKLKERHFDDESLHERLLLLVEEVGELVNACRHISGMNVDAKRQVGKKVGEELTDVINMIFAIGIVLGIDIEKEFLVKEKIVDARFYERSKKVI